MLAAYISYTKRPLSGQLSRTKKQRGILLVLSFLCSLLSLSAHVAAPADAPAGTPSLDSLINVLHHTYSPPARVSLLRKIVKFHWQRPEEVAIWKQIIDLSLSIDSFNVAYESMGSLCRYYYNADRMDSVYYWEKQIEELSNSRNECPDAWFKVGYIICSWQLWNKDYELAMDRTMRQLARAKEKNHPYGFMMAHHNEALIYQAIGRDSDAVVAFRQGLQWFPQSVTDSLFVQQYLGQMIESTLRLDYVDESEALLERYRHLVEATERKFIENHLPFPSFWQKWYLYSYLADLNMRQGDLKQAKEYLDRITPEVEASGEEDMKFPYYHSVTLYHYKKKEYTQAIKAIEKAYAVRQRPGLIAFKVDMLRKAGRYDEAIAASERLFIVTDSIRDEALSRQIQQIYSLNNLNDREKQARDLQYRNEQIATKQYQLTFLLVLLGLLLLLLYLLSRLYRRTQRLKDALVNEKRSLIDTEKHLLLAKEEAERANREKSAFIASISHEIRTPLNAIVGFSELLTDDAYDEEEKISFATLINTNSELLMILINDVLELSRLESGSYKLNCKPCDMIACCQEAIDGMCHRVAPGVELRFKPPVESYTLQTDRQRLLQLLTNLLTNAAKFTPQGSITLSVEIDDPGRQVRFAVSDTGCGIPEDKFNTVFQHFEKLDEFQQGTGLGLPICRHIALKLGGSLFIDPLYKDGARFVFIHPFDVSI